MNHNYYGNTQRTLLLIKIVRFIVIPMVIIAGEMRIENQYPKYICTKVYLIQPINSGLSNAHSGFIYPNQLIYAICPICVWRFSPFFAYIFNGLPSTLLVQ